ncbi:hypothetical protein Trco_001950 [Trichoderma cornu-damae]|uniref:Zn(2)-C6 fungal-type domain-containing protein n=1 Tax=Trichoderma cornu-damae TaxID=654480 RepID=A0A9P8TYN8_9HYPO|nr:hypothetical protein Trco_001950 [Trichoderma cornu-damae]
MTLKSCWTCRDRKVKCDLGLPSCDNCRHRKIRCQGYGLRLSWPRKGDQRRAVEFKSTVKQEKHMLATLYQHSLFQNMTKWDMDLFYELSEAKPNLTYTKMPIPPAPPSIPSLRLRDGESGLLQYFIDMGSRLLILDNLGHLTGCILQLAFYDATPASDAILCSLLTLSSLHLARTEAAMMYKIRALSYLQQSLKLGNIGPRSLQHFMASMLLYLCETFHISSSTKEWAEYLCGAKQIIALGVVAPGAHIDLSMLFDWVSYHEAFALFGLVYWKPAVALRGMNFCAMDPEAARSFVPRHNFGCDRQVLGYTSSIFTSLVPCIADGVKPSHLQMQELYTLEAKLRAGLLGSKLSPIPSGEPSQDHDQATELHRLGALIYLNRAVLGYSGEEPRHKILVDKGLGLLCSKLTYIPSWPAFVIACEAREDSQRMTALEILTKAGEEPRSYNMRLLRRLVEACWNQDDLHDEEALDYHMKLRIAIRTAPHVPPFS